MLKRLPMSITMKKVMIMAVRVKKKKKNRLKMTVFT